MADNTTPEIIDKRKKADPDLKNIEAVAAEVAMGANAKAVEAPKPPMPVFGDKVILNREQEAEAFRARIKDHEAALVVDELQLFEAELIGQSAAAETLRKRIATTYTLVNTLAQAYNARYGNG